MKSLAHGYRYNTVELRFKETSLSLHHHASGSQPLLHLSIPKEDV